jgi:hypothetical protein
MKKSMLSSYSVFDPGVDRPLHKVSREEAIRHFEHHVVSIEERLAQLQLLVESAGIELDFSDRSLHQLDQWFPAVISSYGVENEWPTPEALSICSDLAMYLGEVLRRRGPKLEWRLELGDKRDMAYQRPVIAGFQQVRDPSYSVDYDDMLCGYAVRLAQGGDAEKGYIPKILKSRLQFI